MKWTERQILDTLRFIEQSDYDEVRLETEGFRLHVRKSGTPAQLDDRRPREAPHVPSSDASQAAPSGDSRRPAEERHVPEGIVAIRAPMIGTFYRAPAPHLPPFVAEGGEVTADDTVCLIEVMKLFNTLKAGVAGKVVRIFAQNAAPVAKDEVLMLIEPRPAGGRLP